MITLILFTIIGFKLNIMSGWYLGLLITYGIFSVLEYTVKLIKFGKEKL